MWALRRASITCRYQVLSVGISHASTASLERLFGVLSGNRSIVESPTVICDCCLCYHTGNGCSKYGATIRNLSSLAGAKSSDSEDDLEEGFSKLETGSSSNTLTERKEGEDESEPELSDDEDGGGVDESSQVELDLSDTEADSGKKKSTRKKKSSALFKAIVTAPGQSINAVVNKWVEEGKDLERNEIEAAMINLCKRYMHGRALQLFEWLETNKRLDFVERDYSFRLDLIAKVRGLRKAESYIEKIPKSFRGEVLYRTLLANCASSGNVKKAEEVFNKMRELEFPIKTFDCNRLLVLYKEEKKVDDVWLMMGKENVKRSKFTYKLLIDNRGQANDISGMDEIYEIMKEEVIEPDVDIQALMAKHYVSSGLKEKTKAILKEMEGGNLKEHRWACKSLLPLYAELGKADDVRRVWKICESNPRVEECMVAIESWGKLNEIDEAEEVFKVMLKKRKRPSSKHYSPLMKVYANHKMLTKGVNLVKQMADKGCRIGPLIWDALVKLHVEAGEVEKADTILQEATQQKHMKPMFMSYMAIMDQYVKKGDIHNSEKIFLTMRQAGYGAHNRQRIRLFQALLNAYINAKAPACGFRERMKADNVFLTRSLTADLAKVDAFRKTAILDLLD